MKHTIQNPISKKTTSLGSKFSLKRRDIFAMLWIFGVFALISIIFFAVGLMIPGIVFISLGLFLSLVLMIPLPNKLLIYEYLFRSVRYIFSSNKKIEGSKPCNELFIYKGYKDNVLLTKKETIVWYRVSGRDLNSVSNPEQLNAVSALSNFFKVLENNQKVTLLKLSTMFDLTNNIEFLSSLRENSTSYSQIHQLSWLIDQYDSNFLELTSYQSNRENQNDILPNPVDEMYLIGFHGSNKDRAQELADILLPNLNSNVIETFPATEVDVKKIIENTYGKQMISFKLDNIEEEEISLDQTNFTYNRFKNAFLANKIIVKPKYMCFESPKENDSETDKKNKMYCKLISIRDFSTVGGDYWLNSIYKNSKSLIVQKVSPLTQKQQNKRTKKAVMAFDKKYSAGSSSIVQNQENQADFQKVHEIYQGVKSNELKLLNSNFYFFITASSKENLDQEVKNTIHSLKNTLSINPKHIETFDFMQFEAFNNFLITSKDKLASMTGIDILSTDLGMGFPFQTPYSITDNGFLMGFDKTNTVPIFKNLENKSSYSGMIIGKTRSGKSFFAKLLTCFNLLLNNSKIWWFDPNNEMKHLTKNFNGLNIDLSSTDATATTILLPNLIESFMNYTKDKINNLTIEEVNIALDFLLKTIVDNAGKKESLVLKNKDYFGQSKDSAVVVVNVPSMRPIMIYDKLKRLMRDELVYVFYRFLYNKTVLKFNINPLRILRVSDDSNDGIKVYTTHLERTQTWLQSFIPNLNSVQINWLNRTLKKVYADFGIFIQEINKESVLSIDCKFLDNTIMPTFQDWYNVLLEEFNKTRVKNFKKHEALNDSNIKYQNEILNVFDELVLKNRYGQKGLYGSLWAEDTRINFIDSKMINFNIERLCNDIKAKGDTSGGNLLIDAKSIATAQMFLAFNIIQKFIIQNKSENNSNPNELGLIFIDEFHRLTSDEALLQQAVDLVKTGAKYHYGIWTITQDLADLKKLSQFPTLSETLTSNLQYKYIFHVEGEALNSVQEFFDIAKSPLTMEEIEWLKSGESYKGRGLMVTSSAKRTMFNVITSRLNVGKMLETTINFDYLSKTKKFENETQKNIIEFSNAFYHYNLIKKFDPISLASIEPPQQKLNLYASKAKLDEEFNKKIQEREEKEEISTIDKFDQLISSSRGKKEKDS
ncbi:MAG: hypothetical protein ACRC4M_04970 [Mycoplasma sp.]